MPRSALFVLVPVLLLVGGANAHVLWVSRRRRHTTVADVPKRTVALVLGCAPRSSSGHPNRYFVARVRAAAEPYHAGKVEQLLLSGGVTPSGGSEVAAMQEALADLGVPTSSIRCDQRGERTWASIKRAETESRVNSLLVVSQAFHTSRAVYLALSNGMDAHAFNAQDPGALSITQWRLQARETLARARAVLDVWAERARQ